MRKKNAPAVRLDWPVLCKGATLQLTYGVGRGFVSGRVGSGLIGFSGFGGGTSIGERPHYGNLFLVLHVGLVLAAFAGFTLAAALSVLYLWVERRLKRRAADILRLRLPSLVVLERLIARTVFVSLPLLTLGLVAGFIRLAQKGGGGDAAMAVAVLAWAVYAGFLAACPVGRRAAYLALVGFVLVIFVRLVLAGGHFA